ncbi:hypothetical protein L9F63_005110 [Diploptera punctata]|uniref:Uncharacterized protein n=1 Tax=Diploptera punctata TaxID=6984 RepID=A0AAD8E622_DIPPU|nr:hypothetical protein L9F63_005110 [Diploptera punctata]
MKLVWSRFQDSPTVTNVETTNYPIWNIPFPAVTLCNNNQVYKPTVEHFIANLSEQLQLNSSILHHFLRNLPSLIMPSADANVEGIEMIQEKIFKAGYSIQDLMIKVLFHDPLDYPETSLDTTMVEPKKMVTVSLNAQAVESVSEVRSLSVSQRQCWFNGEEEVLKSTNEYSYQTCITECRIRVLSEKCGCIPFFYPLYS